ncbi:MAG: chromosomal replication initiator protein DnaA [Arcobacter sp.]|nr:chromosomal replication initiator protein DnaA [Arcobacter sp.]
MKNKNLKKAIKKEKKKDDILGSSILKPSYTFDSFVVGSSNQLAYSVSLIVLNKLGSEYNPLFIYGETGLGKTHLLQAIGNMAKKKGQRVIYITIEQFMNDFTFCIKNKNMEYFRKKYRKCDILLIDDVQFLSAKEQTQEELLHTFNELYNAEKQIVLTSDRLPSQILGLSDKLKSRFEQGLIVSLEKIGFKMKINIIKMKAKLHDIYLSKEIIEYIAKKLENDSIPKIEGIIMKIKAYHSLQNKKINLKIVKRIL